MFVDDKGSVKAHEIAAMMAPEEKIDIEDLGCILYNGAQYLNFAYNNCNKEEARQIKELEKTVFNLTQEIKTIKTKESLRLILEKLTEASKKVKEIRSDKWVSEYLEQGAERIDMVIEDISELLH